MPIIAGRASAAYGSGFGKGATGDIYAGPFGAYDSLASVTVPSGGVASVTFSGIPSGYKHLQIRAIIKAAPTATDAAYDLLGRFNGDTNVNNSSLHYMGGNGSNLIVGYTGNLGILGSATGSTSTSVFNANIIDILDYTNTNKFKTVRAVYGYDANGSGFVIMGSALWRNTAAINSIEFVFRTGPSFAEYSSFALYGVK
jgi:hypothetical protein